MYNYDVESDAYGVETDKYRMCKQLLEQNVTVDFVIEYFEKHYDEEHFVDKLKVLGKAEQIDNMFIDHHDDLGLDEQEIEGLMEESTTEQRYKWLKKNGYNI